LLPRLQRIFLDAKLPKHTKLKSDSRVYDSIPLCGRVLRDRTRDSDSACNRDNARRRPGNLENTTVTIISGDLLANPIFRSGQLEARSRQKTALPSRARGKSVISFLSRVCEKTAITSDSAFQLDPKVLFFLPSSRVCPHIELSFHRCFYRS